MGLQSIHAAAALVTLVSACAAAGRGAQQLQPGAVISEPAPPGQPFFDDYEDDVMGGAPVVDSIVRAWAGELPGTDERRVRAICWPDVMPLLVCVPPEPPITNHTTNFNMPARFEATMMSAGNGSFLIGAGTRM
jgi:hypothetical protein